MDTSPPNPFPRRTAPLFLFLHIPKTAGSSLRRVLQQMFAPHLHFFTESGELAHTPEHLARWADPAFYDDYLLLGGHVGRNHPVMRAEAARRRRIYISVMRDPVRRAVSGYDFSRRFPRHPMREWLANKTLLQAITTPGPFRDRYVNDQLRYVFGTTNPDLAESRLHEDNHILAPIEKLEAFVDTISAVSGMPRPPAVPRLNTAVDLSDAGIERAEEQPDYPLALEAIAEANAEEARFIERHLRDVLVTTCRKPWLMEEARGASRPAARRAAARRVAAGGA
ncbi:MAG: hypothetical protein ACK44F_10135 [Roseococcus sp.]